MKAAPFRPLTDAERAVLLVHAAARHRVRAPCFVPRPMRSRRAPPARAAARPSSFEWPPTGLHRPSTSIGRSTVSWKPLSPRGRMRTRRSCCCSSPTGGLPSSSWRPWIRTARPRRFPRRATSEASGRRASTRPTQSPRLSAGRRLDLSPPISNGRGAAWRCPGRIAAGKNRRSRRARRGLVVRWISRTIIRVGVPCPTWAGHETRPAARRASSSRSSRVRPAAGPGPDGGACRPRRPPARPRRASRPRAGDDAICVGVGPSAARRA